MTEQTSVVAYREEPLNCLVSVCWDSWPYLYKISHDKVHEDFTWRASAQKDSVQQLWPGNSLWSLVIANHFNANDSLNDRLCSSSCMMSNQLAMKSKVTYYPLLLFFFAGLTSLLGSGSWPWDAIVLMSNVHVFLGRRGKSALSFLSMKISQQFMIQRVPLQSSRNAGRTAILYDAPQTRPWPLQNGIWLPIISLQQKLNCLKGPCRAVLIDLLLLWTLQNMHTKKLASQTV